MNIAELRRKLRREILWGSHTNDRFSEPWCEWGAITRRPLQRLTERELGEIPAVFRCFACQGRYKKRDIGGVELHQRICRWCYPWAGEISVGRLIAFDLRHRQPVDGY